MDQPAGVHLSQSNSKDSCEPGCHSDSAVSIPACPNLTWKRGVLLGAKPCEGTPTAQSKSHRVNSAPLIPEDIQQ